MALVIVTSNSAVSATIFSPVSTSVLSIIMPYVFSSDLSTGFRVTISLSVLISILTSEEYFCILPVSLSLNSVIYLGTLKTLK